MHERVLAQYVSKGSLPSVPKSLARYMLFNYTKEHFFIPLHYEQSYFPLTEEYSLRNVGEPLNGKDIVQGAHSACLMQRNPACDT